LTVRARRRAIVVAALAGASVWWLAACGKNDVKDPAYLLVELAPTDGAFGAPKAARVQIDAASGPLTVLCVNIRDATQPATFVLQRDAAKDPSARVKITVTGYVDLAGDSGEAGKEFACPEGALPPPITTPQSISVDFCASAAKRLVFHVGATCDCAPDGGAGSDAGACDPCTNGQTCGAGLSSAAHACDPKECCGTTVSDACALDSVR
jgi:hypothetical protein